MADMRQPITGYISLQQKPAYFLPLKILTSLASRLLISGEGKLLMLLNCWRQGPSVKGITLSVWKIPRKIQYVHLSKI
jgi:hypothetical protein